MRRTLEVKIDKSVYTVRELTVKEIIGVFNKSQDNSQDANATDSISFLQGELDNMLKLAIVEDVELEEFLTYTPSDLRQLYDAFHEVNEVFFDIAGRVGMGELLDRIIESIRMQFSEVLVSSLSPATQTALTTDTPSTLQQ